MKTKIIIRQYRRRLESILQELNFSLPKDLQKERKTIINTTYKYFPELSELEDFITEIKEDELEFTDNAKSGY